MKNVTISAESPMFHVPMCVMCAEKEVQIVVNATGAGYCSAECEESYWEVDEAKEHFDSLLAKQYEDEPFGPMSERYAEYDEERKLEGDRDCEPDESMDGDFDSGMASAGFGTDEDYGYYGDEF